jgi:UDP-N-acetylglucosamine 2-epimerase (non-hydrolysing)
VVQGDTTTAFVGALAAYYAKIPVAHVEAGLRTSTRFSPFPEEMNRRLISRIAEINFAPTRHNRDTLLGEGIAPASIHVTGNTGIDTLHAAVALSRGQPSPVELAGRRLLLVTAHRRESFGQGLRDIFASLRAIAERHPEVVIVFPVHLNPNVQAPAREALGNLPNVVLTAPLDYLPFVRLMADAYLILSDSGGVQEEAPALGVPVLVMREETERTEAVHSGMVTLVGTSRERIESECEIWLADPVRRATFGGCESPFGDGHASERIAAHLLARLSLSDGAPAPPDFTG